MPAAEQHRVISNEPLPSVSRSAEVAQSSVVGVAGRRRGRGQTPRPRGRWGRRQGALRMLAVLLGLIVVAGIMLALARSRQRHLLARLVAVAALIFADSRTIFAMPLHLEIRSHPRAGR